MNTELQDLIRRQLEILFPDYKEHPDFKDTPVRVAKSLEHFFRQEDYEHHFDKRFPTDNDEMVIVKDIKCASMCPHHLLPILYMIHIGYIPNGYAIGLSKLARISKAIASFPILQENVTYEIARQLDLHLLPLGVMVVVKGIHTCMCSRGVEQDAETITSACLGALRDKPQARHEFLNLIK